MSGFTADMEVFTAIAEDIKVLQQHVDQIYKVLEANLNAYQTLSKHILTVDNRVKALETVKPKDMENVIMDGHL